MKRFVLTLAFFQCINFVYIYAQCCPYLNSIELIPTNPIPTDSVYLVTDVTTPNAGLYLGYEVFHSGSLIVVEACYFEGELLISENFIDTINLGIFPVGTYTLIFVAYSSYDYFECNHIDTNFIETSFDVFELVNIDNVGKPLKIQCYPNPFQNEINFTGVEIANSEILIYSLDGKEILRKKIVDENKIDVSELTSGNYILKVITGYSVQPDPTFPL